MSRLSILCLAIKPALRTTVDYTVRVCRPRRAARARRRTVRPRTMGTEYSSVTRLASARAHSLGGSLQAPRVDLPTFITRHSVRLQPHLLRVTPVEERAGRGIAE